MKAERETEKRARRKALRTTVKRLTLFSIATFIIFVVTYLVDDSLATTEAIPSGNGEIYYLYTMPIDLSLLFFTFFFLWLIGIILILWFSWIKTQNSFDEFTAEITKDDLRRAIQSRYRNRFWISFGLYSAIMVFLIIAFFVLKDSRIWHDYDPWFSLLFAMRNIFPFAIAALWAGGAAVLLFSQWKQSASDIVGLVDSIEQMHTGVLGDVIEVPRNLRELRPTLQEMFDRSCKDRQSVLETERKKNDLILYLAHDLKTPLTSVIGYLSLLSESPELDAQQQEYYVKIARDKALRLESLTNQFFEISRFNFMEMQLSKTAFSLNLLLLQITDEFYPLLKEESKHISVSCEEEIEIVGDANLLARALNNIIRNAVSYGTPETTIEISAYRELDLVLVSIANEGKDISQQQLNMIFEKFYRLDEARTSESGGSGLGLAIAREIITRHKGSINASSKDGKIVFELRLPQA